MRNRTFTGRLFSAAVMAAIFASVSFFGPRGAEAKEHHAKTKEIANIFQKGVKLEDAGDYAGAEKVFLDGLEKAKAAKDDPSTESYLSQLGFICYKTSRWGQAEDYDNQSLSLAEKSGDDNAIARDLGDLANLLIKQGEAPRAVTLQLRALDLRKKIGDPHATALTMADLATAYAVSGDYNSAVPIYSDSIDVLNKTDDKEAAAYTTNNLARAYEQLRQFDKALDNFSRAAALYKQLGDNQSQSQAYRDIGFIDKITGKDTESAKAYAEADQVMASKNK